MGDEAILQGAEHAPRASTHQAFDVQCVGAMQVYSAAKAGLVNFVRAFAEPLSRRNIRLLAFCPQFISTALVKQISCLLLTVFLCFVYIKQIARLD